VREEPTHSPINSRFVSKRVSLFCGDFFGSDALNFEFMICSFPLPQELTGNQKAVYHQDGGLQLASFFDRSIPASLIRRTIRSAKS
jgi:hypothetical protein